MTLTIEDYRALGRIEGFMHARHAVEHWAALAGDDLIRADERRRVQIEQRAQLLLEAGGTFENCQAFADAADRRFRDAFEELCLALRWELKPEMFPQPGAQIEEARS